MSVDRENAGAVLDGFYADAECCMGCGVPQSIAPELVGWTEGKFASCYWKRQPVGGEELEAAIKILQTQELGCHRYAGCDPEILKKLPPEECDHLYPENAWQQGRKLEYSGAEPKFSLSASREGFIRHLWRWITG
jgi:hypothetical protein